VSDETSARHEHGQALRVRIITRAEHDAWIGSRASVSFLQTPQWADVKLEWRAESVGWFNQSDALVGAGLILYRNAPIIKRSLAYLPEGPDIDWSADSLSDWLQPLIVHVSRAGAFTLKIGVPVVARSWSQDTIKNAVGPNQKLRNIEADFTNPQLKQIETALRKLNFTQPDGDSGFGDGQPKFVYQLNIANQTDEQLLTGFNQLWRRNIKKAEKADVSVREGNRSDLAAFHEVYKETAERDHFRPRPLFYFERYWDAFQTHPERIKLFLAEIDGEVAAATIWIRVGTHSWYSYGASTTKHRDARPSNAIQWAMIRAARDNGAEIYDMRGISETLDEANPLFGLIRFKLGIGGGAVEYIGEHDYAISKPLVALYNLYRRIR
jgi:lipid II:glycine glycyltransferase (peptidoglycan interpeptide bridge formation enzyme)